MKTAIVISSFVSASRVGATASAFCLRRLGIETFVLPTTLLGRHPGWGDPGGKPVPIGTLAAMWKAIKAQNIKIDAVMTGYMASAAHVALARQIIDYVTQSNPDAIILVDPVMGDHGKLYIDENVASGIISKLLPLADLITPNLWEMGYIYGEPLKGVPDILDATQELKKTAIITSVEHEGKIGALCTGPVGHLIVTHERFDNIPHGGGDALSGTVLAHILRGDTLERALSHSVSSIFAIIKSAVADDMGELPLIREQDQLVKGPLLGVQELRS